MLRLYSFNNPKECFFKDQHMVPDTRSHLPFALLGETGNQKTITSLLIISVESRILLMEHNYPPPPLFLFLFFSCLFAYLG